jgi:opacity protein-like surface antigen
MRTQRLSLAVGGALAVSAAVASAQAPDDRGWLLEASVLEVHAPGYREWPVGDVFRHEKRGLAVKGGYAFARHFALQAGYSDFGARQQLVSWRCPDGRACATVVLPPSRVRVDLETLSFAALGTWQATDKVDLFGRVGVVRANMRVESSSASGALSASRNDRERGTLRGAGVGVWLAPRWRLDVQYERVDFDFESAGIGATYRF